MPALKTRAGPAAALALVEKFYANQLEDPDPLSAVEMAKIEDLRGDARWIDREASSSHPRWMARRGRLFEWFERRIGGRLWPHWLWHGIESVRRWLVGKPLPSGPVPHAHGIPHGTPVEPPVFAVDFRLLDRLSGFYGGKFRSSILLNYMLGTIAGGALILVLLRLSGLSVPFGLQPWIKWLDDYSRLPWGLIVETLCIGLILLIYMHGRTPERTGGVLDFTRSRWAGRWHQRWLEYRVLAERFRSFELLLPLGAEFTQRPPFVPEELPSRFWHERYYLWSIAGKEAEVQSVRAYRDRVLGVMAAQEHYHAHNYRRRGAIAHRLHAVATFLFFAALIIGSFELFIEFGHLNFGEGTWGSGFKYLEEWRPTLVFFAALSPIVSAAIHGVLAQSEYTKLADTSGEVAVRIHDQYEQFAKLPVSDDPADAGTLEPMRKTVLAFAETAINEASGWRAMLRDKNVPLA